MIVQIQSANVFQAIILLMEHVKETVLLELIKKTQKEFAQLVLSTVILVLVLPHAKLASQAIPKTDSTGASALLDSLLLHLMILLVPLLVQTSSLGILQPEDVIIVQLIVGLVQASLLLNAQHVEKSLETLLTLFILKMEISVLM